MLVRLIIESEAAAKQRARAADRAQAALDKAREGVAIPDFNAFLLDTTTGDPDELAWEEGCAVQWPDDQVMATAVGETSSKGEDGEPPPSYRFTPRSQRTQREQQPELEPFCIGRQSDRDRFEEVEVTIVPASPASSSSAAADAAANRNNNTTAAADQQQPQPQQKEEGNGSPSTSESEGEASTSASSSAAVKTTDAAATSTVPAGEPPLTPRSLASSIAARRQANHKSRIHENGALTPRGSRAQQSPTGAA